MMLISMIQDLDACTFDAGFFRVGRTNERTDEQGDSRSWIWDAVNGLYLVCWMVFLVWGTVLGIFNIVFGIWVTVFGNFDSVFGNYFNVGMPRLVI